MYLSVRANEDARKGTGPCEVRWQGKRLDGFRVRHEAIVSGGELSFGSD